MKSAVSPQVSTAASKPSSSTREGATVKPAGSWCNLPCLWPKGTQPCLQANYRKGGLLCLAASAVGLADHGQEFLQRIVPPVLNSFTDQDSRVRYYACEVCGGLHLQSCALAVRLPSLCTCTQAQLCPLCRLQLALLPWWLARADGLAMLTLECRIWCLLGRTQCQRLQDISPGAVAGGWCL